MSEALASALETLRDTAGAQGGGTVDFAPLAEALAGAERASRGSYPALYGALHGLNVRLRRYADLDAARRRQAHDSPQRIAADTLRLIERWEG